MLTTQYIPLVFSRHVHGGKKTNFLLCHLTVLHSRCVAACSPLTWHEYVSVCAASVCETPVIELYSI